MTPRRYIHETRRLAIRCRLEWVDFEGRTGVDDVKNVLRNAEAKQILVVCAPPDVRANLVRARDRLVCDGIAAPAAGEWVNVTSDASVFLLKLKERLLSNVKFIDMRMQGLGLGPGSGTGAGAGAGGAEYAIGAFEGVLCMPPEDKDAARGEGEGEEAGGRDRDRDQSLLELAPLPASHFDVDPRTVCAMCLAW